MRDCPDGADRRRRSSFTDWDWWVLAGIAMSFIGWTVTVVMANVEDARTVQGFAAALTCQLYAGVIFVIANIGPRWLTE